MLSRRDALFGLATVPLAFSGPPALACLPPPKLSSAGKLIRAAEAQIGVTTIYDGAYRRIPYPLGDVEPERGVCCDVIIRAYRRGLGIDLQKLVHLDMKDHFSAYPQLWGLKRPDTNIDHRRVPNLAVFLKRHGVALPKNAPYQPGDIVTQLVGGGLPHVVLVSDRLVPDTHRYQIIHNIGAGAERVDGLGTYPITGHFRYL